MIIIVDGISVTKSAGTEVPRPIQPSNVMIMKLELKDKSAWVIKWEDIRKE
jgi:large subunit ribosomal protein L24